MAMKKETSAIKTKGVLDLKWALKNKFQTIIGRLLSSKSIMMETMVKMAEDKKIIEEKYEGVKALNLQLNQTINRLMTRQETGMDILRLQTQIEALKKSQDLFCRAEKLSFFCSLAARLAHEIKNPLVAISTFIQLLPQKYDDEEFKNNFYTLALEETNRVNNLLTELLDVAKPRESSYVLTDLPGLFDQIAFLLSPQASAKEITVVKKYHPHIGLVWMDPEKIKQVIINLLSNALEFIPEGGRIEIITTLVKEKKKNPGLCIIINDNGPGIPQSIIPKIFDPYFTTKHKGSLYNGTGLGLFIAYQNILDHQGTIEVESTVDVGTKFTIFLPTSRPEHYESITPGS